MLDSLLPNAAWVAGGLAVTYLTRSRRKRTDNDAKNVTLLADQLPDSPTSERGEQTIRWLNEQVTPGRDSVDNYHIKASRGATEALAAQPQRLLPAGTLVCFYDVSGALLVSKRGEERCLDPILPGFFKDTGSVSFLPTSAIFVVIREAMLTGFKVFSGEDHLLQAVKSPEDPHRVQRSRFGESEKWHLTSEGFVNSKWNKPLGFEVKELRCVLVEDMRRYERRHVKDKGAMEEQIQYHVSREQYLNDEIATLQTNLAAQEKENETRRQRLHDLQQTCYRLRVDAEQKAAVIAQLENRLADAGMRIQMAEQALDAEARLSMEYKGTSDRVADQADRDRVQLARELAETTKRMQSESEEMAARFTVREEVLKKGLRQAENDVANHQRLLSTVTEERDRLDAALQSISNQMEVLSGTNSRRVSDLDLDAEKFRELREMLEEAQRPRRESGSSSSVSTSPGQRLTEGTLSKDAERSCQTRDSQQSVAEFCIPPGDQQKQGVHRPPHPDETEVKAAEEGEDSLPRQEDAPSAADEATTTPPTSTRSQSERGQKNEAFAMLAPGISFGSQKLRILLEDDEPQASSQCSVATPRIMTPQEYAEALQEVQSRKVPDSVNSSSTDVREPSDLKS